MRDGRNREALPILDQIIRDAPDDGDAYAERGAARWGSLTARADGVDEGFATIQARMCLETQPACPDVDAALSDFGRAIALLAGPQRAGALSQRARIHLTLGHDALALADDDEAIRLDPGNARARQDRAVLRERLGDADGAMADLDEVLRIRPGSGEDLVMRADLRKRNGDLAGARADLDDALAHVPPGPEPDWVQEARTLRRAVALPDEPGMGADSGPLTVQSAEVTTDPHDRPALSVTFDASAAARLAAYTAEHVGSEIEIRVGDEIVSKPRILSPITAGIVVLSGNFETGDVERMQRMLGTPGAVVTLHEVR